MPIRSQPISGQRRRRWRTPVSGCHDAERLRLDGVEWGKLDRDPIGRDWQRKWNGRAIRRRERRSAALERHDDCRRELHDHAIGRDIDARADTTSAATVADASASGDAGARRRIRIDLFAFRALS